MQITPILISLVLVSIVQAAWVTKIPKPKLNSLLSKNLETPEIPKHKLPEERRKFSLFPKSYMKYVISPEPIYKIATHKPIVHEKKKPLMKKFNLLDKKNEVIENEATESAKPIFENNLAVSSKMDSTEASKEVNIEIVKENSEESLSKQTDISKEEELENNSNETKMVTAQTKDKESPNVAEVSQENKSDKPDSTKNSKENESADWTEFILVDPIHKTTESAKVSTEEPEEFVTTEFYEEPKVMRRKRGSNVIEEENLASTVAGYKYTWKDTRLHNDVAFKNIHS